MKKILDKNKNKIEDFENIFIIVLVFGAVLLSISIIISSFFKSISALLGMIGSFLSFFSAITLIILWLIKFLKKHG